jgi:uncharacterized integral membrane protein
MTRRIIFVIVVVPVAVVLIALAVANRELVSFTLNPFNPGDPAMTLNAPLFAFLFAALAVGVVIGGCATWVRQGRYRRIARERSREADRLKARAEEEKQARKDAAASAGQLPAPGI